MARVVFTEVAADTLGRNEAVGEHARQYRAAGRGDVQWRHQRKRGCTS